MTHRALLLGIQHESSCCSETELQTVREQKGRLWSSCWSCVTAFLQGQKRWSLTGLALSEVTEAMSSLALTATCIHLPIASLQGEKIHMSPAMYGLLHTWISYHVVSVMLWAGLVRLQCLCYIWAHAGGWGVDFIYAWGSSFPDDCWFLTSEQLWRVCPRKILM